MKKIMLVFGTRPEAIKMAPLVKAFEKEKNIISKVCVTAQHREMLDQVLDMFDIKPDYDLNIMKAGQDLFDVTTNVLLGLKDVLNDFDPNVVLVHPLTLTFVYKSVARLVLYLEFYLANLPQNTLVPTVQVFGLI